MKKYLLLLALTACASGGAVVTMDCFYEVPLGATTSEVVEIVGRPYAIHDLGPCGCEYEYVERVKIGYRDAEARHYFILIKDGQVVSKRVRQSIPLPYGFDSYEMQTTQKED